MTGLPSGASDGADDAACRSRCTCGTCAAVALLTRPMRASSSMTTGVWNTIAKARNSSSTRLIVDSMPKVGFGDGRGDAEQRADDARDHEDSARTRCRPRRARSTARRTLYTDAPRLGMHRRHDEHPDLVAGSPARRPRSRRRCENLKIAQTASAGPNACSWTFPKIQVREERDHLLRRARGEHTASAATVTTQTKSRLRSSRRCSVNGISF